jgi:signal transduction histidine kinase
MLKNSTLFRLSIGFISLIILGIAVWSISVFYNRIKADERDKMLVLTEVIKAINADFITSNDDIKIPASVSQALTKYRDLTLIIQNRNNNNPAIIVDENGTISSSVNIPEKIENDSILLYDYLEDIKDDNEPIQIDLLGSTQTLYYGNSQLLTNIKYYPLILFVTILLFISLLIFFYATSKESEKNKLWAGMAKETAHQIGTPLSSLVGWLEILRSEGKVDPDYISEIEKDIDRLQTITERFSKVGSQIKLEKTDIVDITQQTYDYLKNRSSNLIEFTLDLPQEPTYVMLNTPLYSWTIENLVKNAIDAMKGKGQLKIELVRSGNWIRILVKDNGKGIPLSNFKTVFTPGYSTKKRGWGLGLSLAKRIIEGYHNGKIKVLFSEMGVGTTFEIKLKRI